MRHFLLSFFVLGLFSSTSAQANFYEGELAERVISAVVEGTSLRPQVIDAEGNLALPVTRFECAFVRQALGSGTRTRAHECANLDSGEPVQGDAAAKLHHALSDVFYTNPHDPIRVIMTSWGIRASGVNRHFCNAELLGAN